MARRRSSGSPNCRPSAAERAAVVHAGPVRAAGEDGHRGRRRGSRCGQRAVDARHRRVGHVRAGHPVGVPGAAAGLRRPGGPRRRDVGGHGVARRGRVELGQCEAVLGVVPGRPWCRGRRRAPGRTSAGSGRRATSTAHRRPSSRSRTATSGRTGRTRRSRSATPPNSATTRGLGARSPSDQRANACAHPGAVFHGKPITVDDVLDSPMIADPIHMLEIVMRVQGGAGRADRERRRRATQLVTARCGSRVSASTFVQDSDLRRRPDAHPDRPRRRHGRSRWRGSSAPTSTWHRSTTATRSPC